MCLSEAREFLKLLLRKVEGEQCLTLTAIHPDRDRASPSRHILVENAATDSALEQLMVTNTEHGYGAYFGVAARRVGLSRWQRGGVSQVVSLPALFVDIDREPREALADLKRFPFSPSVVVLSGFGVHAYWLLNEPLKENIARANHLLGALAKRLHGDSLTVAQCMRLPGSYNTKPQRHHTRCQVKGWRPDLAYEIAEFAKLLPVPKPSSRKQPSAHLPDASATAVNAALIATVADAFRERGYRHRESWLNGPCPFSHRHKHGDAHRSFGYVESESKSRGKKSSANIGHATLPKSTLDYLAYGATVGQRNAALFAAACQFRDALYTVTEAGNALVPRYLADGEAHESVQARESEARRTIQSAYRRPPRPAMGHASRYRSMG